YSLGRSFFTYDLSRADSLVRDSTARADSLREARGARGAGAPAGADTTARSGQGALGTGTTRATRAVYEPTRLDVTIRVAKDRPTGAVVLRGARIITMRGDEVIPSGDVVVR